MEETNYQEQINAINRKLDVILGFVEQRQRKQEEIDDLITDVNIVAKDAFKNTVVMLDKAGVELDSGELSGLLIKLLQNIGTFYEMMEMMESAKDFMKDLSPILHQVGLDAVNKMNELDQKGYFEALRQMGTMADKWVQALSTVKMDDKTDDKSMWQLMKELRSPEVRKSLSYALRLVKEVNSPGK